MLSRLGNVFPDLDSAGEDSLSWSFAVGVVVSAFLFWLFLCYIAVNTKTGQRRDKEKKTIRVRFQNVMSTSV